ncbi:MAG: KH domain-containing protein [Chloroflexi bacterium]|nr:KH domain-containing protein [Chloroflexota bacterium]MBU1749082.1 KH domain-containing protein [Chloroflexota bacterium]MBU1877597.1 KH domain-containing protein [Chloroflexota bacterium]
MAAQDLVEYIARGLVDEPQRVQVSEIRGAHATVIELRVARNDMGRVIGKEGRIANAMRLLLKVPASKEGKHVILEIV